jgi:hypothetical protein
VLLITAWAILRLLSQRSTLVTNNTPKHGKHKVTVKSPYYKQKMLLKFVFSTLITEAGFSIFVLYSLASGDGIAENRRKRVGIYQ